MMVLIVVVHLLCNGLFLAVTLLVDLERGVAEALIPWAHAMAIVNPLANFVVYYRFLGRFRAIVQKMFCIHFLAKKGGRIRQKPSYYNNHHRSTSVPTLSKSELSWLAVCQNTQKKAQNTERPSNTSESEVMANVMMSSHSYHIPF